MKAEDCRKKKLYIYIYLYLWVQSESVWIEMKYNNNAEENCSVIDPGIRIVAF